MRFYAEVRQLEGGDDSIYILYERVLYYLCTLATTPSSSSSSSMHSSPSSTRVILCVVLASSGLRIVLSTSLTSY